ncbi:pilin [Pseudomonas aeruginosa]|nr:pilin [Pseudomonas aeruginosa]MDZ5190229.1 pilin [Pseudomonas aeruginosa]
MTLVYRGREIRLSCTVRRSARCRGEASIPSDKGSYTWACTSNADNKYLPKTCQTATTTTP